MYYSLTFYVTFLLMMNAGITVPYCAKKNYDIDMMDDIVADGLPLRMESELYSTVVVVRACVREESRSLDSTKTHSFCNLSILYSK